MKQLLFIIAGIFINLTANSQIEKGNWMVGGSGSFSTNNPSSGRTKSINILINPDVGYFFWNKIAAGMKFYYASQDISRDLSNPGTSGITIDNFSAGPFARYYFLNTEKSVNFFAEANYSYGIYKTSGTYVISDGKSSNFSFLAGTTAYFNSSVAFEFTLGYYSTKDLKYGYDNQGLQIGMGLQIHLQTEKNYNKHH